MSSGRITLEETKSPFRRQLERWLNKNMKIEMTDGRILIGIFLCTDRDRNVILGSCSEYLKPEEDGVGEEPRVLGLAMVPGHHIVSIQVDENASGNMQAFPIGGSSRMEPCLLMVVLATVFHIQFSHHTAFDVSSSSISLVHYQHQAKKRNLVADFYSHNEGITTK